MLFANRISSVRKNMKLSQEELGEMAGVSQRTVAYWEAGERTPSHAVLTDLAKKLDVSTDYLLGLSDEPKRKEPVITDDELRISTYNRIKNLPEPVLARVLDLIDAIQAARLSAAPPDPAADSAPQAPRGSSEPTVP